MGRTGRPPLPVGTFGEIWTRPKGSGFMARCFYRDYDGVTREATKQGPSSRKAIANLKESLAERRVGEASDDIHSDTKFSVVCEAWWEEFKEKKKSPGTRRNYRDSLDNHIIPALGDLRMHEVTLGRIGELVKKVSEKKGAPTAKTMRSVLSSVFGFAGRHDAVKRNPTKDVERIEQDSKAAPRALTMEQAVAIRKLIHEDERAQKRDLPDFSDMMIATGMRIGEASAVTWGAVDLTPGSEAVEIRGTVVREKGVGLYIKPKPKTPAGYRTLELPSWTVNMLKARWDRMKRVDISLVTPDTPVFTAPMGGLRDPSNTQADLREAFDQPRKQQDGEMAPTTEWTWVTSHVWRKTVGTLMKQAGRSSRDIADQLGHAKVSMTEDIYFGREKRVTAGKGVMEAIADM
jgi:integrase